MGQQLAVSVLVVVLMASVGLRTEPAALGALLRRPGLLGLAAVLNVAVVPALAWGVLRLIPLPEPIALGFVLCAVCPGGPSSALLASRARGDLEVAIAATVGLGLLGVFTAPPTLSLLLGQAVEVDLGALVLPMMGTLALFQLLPLGAALLVRLRWPALAARLARPLERVANTLLLLVILGLLATKGGALVQVGWRGVGVACGLVLASLGVGALASRQGPAQRSLALVTAVRSISLALLLTARWLPDPQVDAAVLTYGLFSMVLPFGAAWAWSRPR